MSMLKNYIRRGRRLVNQVRGRDVWFGRQVSVVREHLGTDYGGWNVCPGLLNPESIVYSFGVGSDVSFDLAMINRFGVNVHAFDPTPMSIEWVKKQKLPDKFKFYEWGIASYDGIAHFNPPLEAGWDSFSTTIVPVKQNTGPHIEAPVKRLKTIMETLGHARIDVLKMDVEGSEYDALDDIITSQVPVVQLLVEFHHWFDRSMVGPTKKVLERLNQAGYAIFDIAPLGREYCLVHRERGKAAMR